MPPKQRRGPGGRRRSRMHSKGPRDSDIAGEFSVRRRGNGGKRRSKRSTKEPRRQKEPPATEGDLDAALDSYFGKAPRRQKEKLNDDLDTYFANKAEAEDEAAVPAADADAGEGADGAEGAVGEASGQEVGSGEAAGEEAEGAEEEAEA